MKSLVINKMNLDYDQISDKQKLPKYGTSSNLYKISNRLKIFRNSYAPYSTKYIFIDIIKNMGKGSTFTFVVL